MTEKSRDNLILLSSKDRLTKESLKQKLIEITCAYGRAKVREEYVRTKNISRDEQKRGVWRNDDMIFLEQELEEECAGLCSEWADQIEEALTHLIREHLEEDEE